MSCSTHTIDVTAGQARQVLLRVKAASTGAPYGAPDWAFRLEVLSPWSIGTPLLTVPFSAITLPDGPALVAELPGTFSGGKSGGRYPARIIRRYNPTGWEHTDVESDKLVVAIGGSGGGCSPGGIAPDGVIDVRVTDSEIIELTVTTALLPLYDPATGVKAFHTHPQSTPASSWAIEHGLGGKPAGIQVWDSAGSPWFPSDVEYIDANNLILHFGTASFSGTAYLS